jgi:beta-lactamase regulating signal transducer with metallopeptidase domain
MASFWNQLLSLFDAGAGFLVAVALKGFIVLSLAAAINTLALRRASASMRHLVWTLALVAIVLLPGLTPLTPRWSVPGIPAIPGRGSSPADAPAAPGAVSPMPTPEAEDGRENETRDEPGPPVQMRPVLVIARDEPTAQQPGVSSRTTSRREATTYAASPATSSGWAVLVWGLGFLTVALWAVSGLIRVRALGRGARRLTSGPTVRLLERLSGELSVRRRVTLLQGGPSQTPVTWGVLRPTILLPSTTNDWPSSRLRAVLLHELAHIRRHDCLTQLVARLACGLYWFNPLAWLAAGWLRRERELACDDAVLRAGPLPSEYAGHLLDLARGSRGRSPGGVAVAMARSAGIGDRLRAVLDAGRPRGVPSRGVAAASLSLAVLLILPLAGAAPAEGETAIRPERKASGVDAAPAADAPTIPAADAPTTPAVVNMDLVGRRSIAEPEKQPQAGSWGCDWLAREGSSSTSINVNDDHLRARLEHGDCELKIDLSGEVEFNEAEDDVAGISRGGELEIEEARGDRSHRLVVRPGAGGELERRWYVDGDQRPFGPESQAWLADMISVLYRRAGYQATERAERILSERGADGLLEEIGHIPGDYTARRYYTVLLGQADLDPETMRRIVRQVGSQLESDYELASLLVAIAEQQPLDESVKIAYVEAAGSIESDYEHRRVLSAILGREGLSQELADSMLAQATRIDSDYELARLLIDVAERYPADRPLRGSYLSAARSIESDYELSRVLMNLLERDDLSAANIAVLLDLARGIDSDYETSRVLTAVLRERGLEESFREPFFALVDEIGSDYERRKVLAAALESGPVARATVESVLELALHIDSDYETAALLLLVAERFPIDEQLRPAFLRVVDTIGSEYERGRALSAAFPRTR